MNIKMEDITVLGRTLDPRYPTNLAIALLSSIVALAGAATQLIRGEPVTASIVWGVGAGFAVFFAWALSRELDPDHEMSAFVGAGLAIIGLLFFDTPALTLLLWLMLALRTVNRTRGLPARPLDSLAVLGLGTWLTWQGYWIAGLVTASAFLLDGLLSPPLRLHLFLSGLALVVTVVISIFHGDASSASDTTTSVAIPLVVMAGLFLAVIATSRHVRTVGDANGKPLNPRRVQAAQVLALLTALLSVWWDGASGVEALLPVWAAMTGVGLYRLGLLTRRHSR